MSVFDLDHVGIAVRDLNLASDVFTRLGFTLTERSYHVATGPGGERKLAGTGNHCFILRRGYVELIAPTTPDYAGRLLADLAKYEGLHLVSFGATTTQEASEFMSRAAGKAVTARRVARPFRERGEDFEAVFEILDLPAGTITEAHLFAIHHVTPEVIWQKPLMTHANGTQELLSVAFCVDDPDELAARVALLFDGQVNGNVVALKAGAIEFYSPETFRGRFGGEAPVGVPSVAALSLSVADLASTARFLASQDISYARTDRALIIPPSQAFGVLIEFTEMET